jgi:hypothetical protein
MGGLHGLLAYLVELSVVVFSYGLCCVIMTNNAQLINLIEDKDD